MQRKFFKKMLMTAALIGVLPVCKADLLIKDYLAAKKEPEVGVIAKVQLISIYEGISYASIAFQANGTKPLFCPPGSLPIETNNLINILDKQIALFEKTLKNQGGFDYNMPVAPILLSGLKKTFPCK